MNNPDLGTTVMADMTAVLLGNKNPPPFSIKRVRIATRKVVDGIVQVENQKSDRPARAGSKTEAARRIYGEMITAGATRQEVVNAFIAQLSISPACANTYFYNCTKK